MYAWTFEIRLSVYYNTVGKTASTILIHFIVTHTYISIAGKTLALGEDYLGLLGSKSWMN